MSSRSGRAFIQIGAGAGDQDVRANMRDGFTEAVKAIALSPTDRVVLVEANPANETLLRRCWEGYPQAEFYMMGIVADPTDEGVKIFYWAEEDAPHYQVFSVHEHHVRAHYSDGTIRSTDVECMSINSFLERFIGEQPVEILAIDIEGLDVDVIRAIDWNSLDCHRVSFERLHLGVEFLEFVKAFKAAGYIPAGNGLDVNGYDVLFVRPRNLIERMRYTIRDLAYRTRRDGLAATAAQILRPTST